MKELLARIETELKKALPVERPEETIGEAGGGGFDVISGEELKRIYLPADALIAEGGKRWRPLLMALCGGLTGRPTAETVLRLTPLPELAHTGTLMIDDIEDGALLRRGVPCAHLRFGVDAAINTGNLLYFLPTYLIDTAEVTAEEKLTLYRIYAKYMRQVHYGQGLDIDWHKNPDLIPSEAAYFQMCRLKTGSLAAMAAEMGLFLAGGNDTQRAAIENVAENVGIVFQIADDVVNLRTGNKGKHRGDDIVEGKKSLPVILFSETGDKAALLSCMKRAAEKGYEASQAEVLKAVNLILENGADRRAEEKAAALQRETVTMLNKFFPKTEARTKIETMISHFL